MLTGVQDITTARYEKLIRHAIKTKGNLLVIALAGSGKTEIAESTLESLNVPYQYINLSVLEAPDLIGVPRVNDETGTMSYATPEFLPYADRTPNPIALVIDELDKAKSELQNPLLELMQFHTVNGRKLNIAAIFCTGNMPDEGAFSLPINHALTNRCMVFKMEVQFPDWRDWAVNHGINPLIVGFLGKSPDLLQVSPNKDDPTAYCRPSPRSWTRAAAELDALPEDADIETQMIVIAGRVGVTAALGFRVWMEHYRHIAPHIDQLVANGTFPPNNFAIDKLLVCAISACNEVAKVAGTRKGGGTKKASDDQIEKVSKHVFDWLETLTAENQIAAVKSTISAKVVIDNNLIRIPSVSKVFGNLKRILTSG